ncbi:putative inorganic phosphate cotransporter [Episyrphus balteatus]|uniref:putative inorganic phosphate cotransporter n=1 Tax=Episyrphus balteatus TaxID=286459 RepID=UPI002486BDFE|nr:putative inorganic phosphate cotransporter [Episyrphus balteatus]
MANNRRFEDTGPAFGIRHIQVVLLFFALVSNYLVRQNASVSVVAMTDANSTNPDFPEFDWNETKKSYILSSFYWGYSLTQVLAGYVCRQFGSKPSLLIATFGSASLSLITPASVGLGGWQVYCGIRAIQGLFQGLLIPTIHDHLAKWSPVRERTRLGALALTGMETGNLLGMAVPGLIAHSHWGWPGISYFAAGCALFWCTLWIVFADSNPVASRFISSEEKSYILASQCKDDKKQKKIPIPWKAILTSVPFGSLVIVRLASIWGMATLQTQIPTYLHGVLEMDIKSNSFFSALPYVVMLCMTYVYLISADTLLKKNIFSLSVVKKTINSIAMWVPAVTLVGLGLVDKTQNTLAIVLITITVGVSGGVSIGSGLNAIDLSSNHAAVLMGILNTLTSVPSMMGPLFVGVIVDDETNRSQWQIVFWTSALLYFLGNLQFIIFSSTENQPWNDEKYMLVNQDDKYVRKSSTKLTPLPKISEEDI